MLKVLLLGLLIFSPFFCLVFYIISKLLDKSPIKDNTIKNIIIIIIMIIIIFLVLLGVFEFTAYEIGLALQEL